MTVAARRLILALAAACGAALTAAQAGMEIESDRSNAPTSEVKVAWDYRGLPKTMTIYEPATGQPVKVWQMGSGASLADLPVGPAIPSSKFVVKPGTEKVFVLVYRNPTGKPIRFFAAPHHVSPPEASLGFEFHCLCVNETYTAPPHGYWYRVVKLTLSGDHEGDLTIKHALIAKKS